MPILKAVIEFVMEILETIVFVGSLFIVVYLFIVQPNQIKGISMEPTFQEGNYIFTSKVTYKMRTPERGDIVVFHAPRNADLEYIKRIIGIPGDTILIQGEKVYVNGREVQEPYIAAATNLEFGWYAQEGAPITVPDGHLWVMGDNRPRSSDSREFGPIKYESVVGQVFYRYFPFDLIGSMKNPYPKDLRAVFSPLMPRV